MAEGIQPTELLGTQGESPYRFELLEGHDVAYLSPLSFVAAPGFNNAMPPPQDHVSTAKFRKQRQKGLATADEIWKRRTLNNLAQREYRNESRNKSVVPKIDGQEERLIADNIGKDTSQGATPLRSADSNKPCNSLYVGNLPKDASEDEVKALVVRQPGYKRICWRTKVNGPMCIVEFTDTEAATHAIKQLYGHQLSNSVRGGLRIDYAKNPLGVRSTSNMVASPFTISPIGDKEAYQDINCTCSAHGGGDLCLQCELCGTWQHFTCYYGTREDVVEAHVCIGCKKPKTPDVSAGFTFITGGSPGDFKSKKAMTIVRKKAMDSFLKGTNDNRVGSALKTRPLRIESSDHAQLRTEDLASEKSGFRVNGRQRTVRISNTIGTEQRLNQQQHGTKEEGQPRSSNSVLRLAEQGVVHTVTSQYFSTGLERFNSTPLDVAHQQSRGLSQSKSSSTDPNIRHPTEKGAGRDITRNKQKVTFDDYVHRTNTDARLQDDVEETPDDSPAELTTISGSEIDTRQYHSDLEAMVETPETQSEDQVIDQTIIIRCVCGVANDQRFIIPCDDCGTWQHIGCYFKLAEDLVETHHCVQCVPRRLHRDQPSSTERSADMEMIFEANTTTSIPSQRLYSDAFDWRSSNRFGHASRTEHTAATSIGVSDVDFRQRFADDLADSKQKAEHSAKDLETNSARVANITAMDISPRPFNSASSVDGIDASSPSSPIDEPLLHSDVVPHMLPDTAHILDSDWTQVQGLLPQSWMWDLEYHHTHAERGDRYKSWTCTPLGADDPKHYPLTMARKPLVLPVNYQWPPISGVSPPPDPRPSAPIDCRAKLTLDVIRDLFVTYEGSLGFYLLINGFLQVIVSDDFDTVWASSHLPHRYGGLHVSYIAQSMEPTMLPTGTETAETRSSTLTPSSSMLNIFRPARTAHVSLNPALRLNDFIEARPKSNHRSERYSGRIGLRVTKGSDQFLLMSTHVITEAILARSHREAIFRRSRDRFDKLNGDWNDYAEIWAGNEKIGIIDKTFDTETEMYPNGFQHDVTLIKSITPAALKDVVSPIPNLGWLNRRSWMSLRQQSSTVKILASTEAHRSAKTLKCSRPSEILVVGEGIFLNQVAAAGNAKSLKDHDASTWKDLVSRALLYRVHPDFDPPNGYSGIALYADGVREDGTEGPGVVGFQSFVQRSGHVQNFAMEGSALDRRLQLGRVAFYGAFEVPAELKEYEIV